LCALLFQPREACAQLGDFVLEFREVVFHGFARDLLHLGRDFAELVFEELFEILSHGGRESCENHACPMKIRTFAEFWPHYVRAHSRVPTRVLHAIGSTLALICIALGITLSPWFFLAAPLIGYAFAWYGHFFVEHNKPATFGHPFYSLAADYVMVWKMMAGTMNAEVAKHVAVDG